MPAKDNSDREAFKDEYIRMQGDRTEKFPQGFRNPENYNIRNSPGREYMKQDNDPRLKRIDPDNGN
ncbi:hypothetical protein [Apibacter adventoris]|uniref:Uncharacterized protein n=1 Tax=Apibacter adventoris TaxID=1679466 RepID=A0A2S8A4K5_9FLAO|nr:hypothetical protein [Apibacter adventoris]PQL89470.1 hypothetical protein C4S77_12575 [Apibacter adventoris]